MNKSIVFNHLAELGVGAYRQAKIDVRGSELSHRQHFLLRAAVSGVGWVEGRVGAEVGGGGVDWELGRRGGLVESGRDAAQEPRAGARAR